MNIILPKTITAAMVGAGTSLAEDPSAAWVSGGTYAIGDLRYLLATHRVYKCAVATAGSTVTPDLDITHWVDMGPTNKWAPFDSYISTPAIATTSLTYVLQPGYFNAVALYGLVGKTYSIVVKDAPGGNVIYTSSGRLDKAQPGWWNYLFWPRITRTKLLFTGIPLSQTAEITLTISGATGSTVKLGMMVIGSYKPLIGSTKKGGGPQYGAQATPVTYSYIKRNDDGTVTIQRGRAATDLTVEVVMPLEAADIALASLQEVLDVPVAWITTDAAGYGGLNTFGLAKRGPVAYYQGYAKCTVDVEGFI